MTFTDDPIADFHRHDAEQQAKLAKLPRCCCCLEHIQQEYAICISDEWFCDDCLDTYYKVEIEY